MASAWEDLGTNGKVLGRMPTPSAVGLLRRLEADDHPCGIHHSDVLGQFPDLYKLNIHKVKIMASSMGLESAPTLIKGPFYESKFHMGARYAENEKYPAHILVRSPSSVGGWDKTGIKPLAYKASSPRRWDDFFYSDFISDCVTFFL